MMIPSALRSASLPCLRLHRTAALCALLVLLACALTLPARAQEERIAHNGVLLELFTSQGCYSCPPADELLGDARHRKDVVALEFHVDYWDTLIYGFAGSWKDPFSSPDYTQRQHAYSRAFTKGMYTPQFIVHGQDEVVGGRGSALQEKLVAAAAQQADLQFYFSGSADAGWSARVEGNLHGDEDFYYAVFLRQHTTEVTAGENKDKTLRNHHIVHTFKRASGRYLTIPPFDAASEGCAVWVQRPQTGAVLAAANCPQVHRFSHIDGRVRVRMVG